MPDLLEKIFAAGVVGAGGAGFPTHVKLASRADTLIVNAAECEPLLASDRYVTRSFAPQITEALLALRAEFGFKRVVIGTKRHYAREVEALKSAFADKNADFELLLTDSFYPAGDEQILIYEATGKTVPPGGIPISVGVVVQNVTTILNIYDAMRGAPVTEKFVTVTGAVACPSIVRAPVGTTVADLIAAAGGTIAIGASMGETAAANRTATSGGTDPSGDASASGGTAAGYVIKGGPMMGKMYPLSQAAALTIGKADGGVIVLPEGHPLCLFKEKTVARILSEARSVCMQCSICTDMCPRRLIGHKLRPNIVMRGMANNLNVEKLSEALLCSECGVCELYACPMQLSPRRINVHVKGLLREKGVGLEDKNVYPELTAYREYRRVPQARIIGRLLPQGYPEQIDALASCEPQTVCIPLKHGVGRPSAPTVAAGDRVKAGDVIAKVEQKDVGCMIHASIDGVVVGVDENITISREAIHK